MSCELSMIPPIRAPRACNPYVRLNVRRVLTPPDRPISSGRRRRTIEDTGQFFPDGTERADSQAHNNAGAGHCGGLANSPRLGAS